MEAEAENVVTLTINTWSLIGLIFAGVVSVVPFQFGLVMMIRATLREASKLRDMHESPDDYGFGSGNLQQLTQESMDANKKHHEKTVEVLAQQHAAAIKIAKSSERASTAIAHYMEYVTEKVTGEKPPPPPPSAIIGS